MPRPKQPIRIFPKRAFRWAANTTAGMPPRELAAHDVGLPEFEFEVANDVSTFDLSSHARARQALQFGLNTPGNDYNVYVLGLDRSGRMTATREFVETWATQRGPADDWIYVVDFDAPAIRGRYDCPQAS